MRQPVTPPTVTATRHNLLTGAREIPLGERFPFDGIAYERHHYAGGSAYDPSCQSPQNPDAEGDDPALIEWDPFEIEWTEQCDNPTPAQIEVVRQRAAASLDAHRSHLIEQVFWTNETQGTDFGVLHPNVGLADTPGAGPAVTILNSGDPLGIVPALSALIGGLGTALAGVRGVIHIPLKALPYVDFYGNSVVVGNQLVPGSADHVLVAGSGYDGSGPDGLDAADGFAWFYATSAVEVRLGPVQIPGPIFIPGENKVLVKALQPVIASWDRGAHLAVQVCLTDPGPDCVGSS